MLIKFNFYLYYIYDYYNNNIKSHRLDGPSYETTDGHKFWYKNGMTHREDGPAIELFDGNKSYSLNNKKYMEKEYWNVVRFKGYL